MPFRKGQAKPPGSGRKKSGSAKQRGIEAFARSIVEDPTYQKHLLARAQSGELAPPVEAMLFHYAYGKPTEPAKDDQRFLEELLAVVLKHAGSHEARQEIRAVIEAHTGGAGLRAVA
jgi:hypothetical protein